MAHLSLAASIGDGGGAESLENVSAIAAYLIWHRWRSISDETCESGVDCMFINSGEYHVEGARSAWRQHVAAWRSQKKQPVGQPCEEKSSMAIHERRKMTSEMKWRNVQMASRKRKEIKAHCNAKKLLKPGEI